MKQKNSRNQSVKISDIYTATDNGWWNGNYEVSTSNDSCAFDTAWIEAGDSEEEVWITFSNLMEAITRTTFVRTNEKEKKLNLLLEACPFVVSRFEEKSRHGNYKAYQWVIHPKAMENL